LRSNHLIEALCAEYNFASKIPSWKWEMFGAILMDDRAKDCNKGSDLHHHEIKSRNRSYPNIEYQYHRNCWEEKLEDEKRVTHVYIIYEEGYRDIEVIAVEGPLLSDRFEEWKPDIKLCYETTQKDRCRKSIPTKALYELGKVVFRIANGKLDYYDQGFFQIPPQPQPDFNNN